MENGRPVSSTRVLAVHNFLTVCIHHVSCIIKSAYVLSAVYFVTHY